MKLKIITLIAVGLLFFSSCSKEVIDPVLEIYLTTKVSENWQKANFNITRIRFGRFEDGSIQNGGILQSFYNLNYETDLQSINTELLYNDTHWDYDNLKGINLVLNHLHLSNTDEGIIDVVLPSYLDFKELDEVTSIENGKTYKIEFIIDLDKAIYLQDGEYFLGDNYEIEITEL